MSHLNLKHAFMFSMLYVKINISVQVLWYLNTDRCPKLNVLFLMQNGFTKCMYMYARRKTIFLFVNR